MPKVTGFLDPQDPGKIHDSNKEYQNHDPKNELLRTIPVDSTHKYF